MSEESFALLGLAISIVGVIFSLAGIAFSIGLFNTI